MLTPVLHSLIVAFVSTFIAFIIMLPLSYYFTNRKSRFQLITEVIILLPLVLPPTVVGLILLSLFGKNDLIGAFLWNNFNFSFIFTLAGAIIATTIIILPIMYQGLKSAFLSIDHDLVWAAKTLSANARTIFIKIILPNCWQPILAGILLSFCRAMGEFGASLMIAGYIEGKTDTIASSIFFMVQQGDMLTAIYLGLINAVIGIIALLVIHILTVRQTNLTRGM
ncbi:molybdate ABC transporter permease subunit [Paenilisteria rocourtiae]|uniref:Molybdate transport system permease protein n=1 Tax=Listeria rocourtiae TaxID=647910 RepID=A0A4R6ZRF9_9LIST|nr:molybdenum ABC transporter permease [Listeria rocourtiae]EUJ46015.1 putative molybdenum ABC transporter permease [Listeria rocourtiae FSL F6-920]MBC1436232.1 molybdenum ABC transporter permease [Listeria rocourtiae]MBC1604224.1 molybdenum ABC transporter permease [Listeria rocourtiae]TDR54729.1 molybdate transport system permease protein [Listeria rocourtiae]